MLVESEHCFKVHPHRISTVSVLHSCLLARNGPLLCDELHSVYLFIR